MLIHKYSEEDLTLSLDTPKASTTSDNFIDLLGTQWEAAMEKGLFRYKLEKNSLPQKVLPGRFNYVAQLNPDRAEKRRKPQEILSQKQPFNPDQFNFNKIPGNEVLLRLEPHWSTSTPIPEEHLVLINVSPLEYLHVLITPYRNLNRVQKVTREGLRLALELILQTSSSDIRVGFNSLCGYASVNHEHWHLYNLCHRLYVEHAPLRKIVDVDVKECYEFEDALYPPGFCFLLEDLCDLSKCLDRVMRLTKFMWENEIAHNLFITRGSKARSRSGMDKEEGQYEFKFDSIRIFVWARLPSFGAKGCEAFNPALCELAGHFPIKTENAFDVLTEEYILKELHAICDEPFRRVRSWIVDHF